jgi:rSAM/selenodomain-associated transferase 2
MKSNMSYPMDFTIPFKLDFNRVFLKMERMNLSIVIPVQGHFSQLHDLLGDLQCLVAEVLVVEAVAAAGESTSIQSDPLNLRDQCKRQILDWGGRWLSSPASRGAQVALGCQHGNGAWLWVLHADTRLDAPVIEYLQRVIVEEPIGWGRFDISFRETHQRLECVAFFMNWRSRLTRICTGDQGMFFHRDCLAHIGGFPNQPLMEDIEISRLLKSCGDFIFLAPKVSVQTSGRRWLQSGWLRTILSMWRFRLQYFFGKSPQVLFDQYYKR